MVVNVRSSLSLSRLFCGIIVTGGISIGRNFFSLFMFRVLVKRPLSSTKVRLTFTWFEYKKYERKKEASREARSFTLYKSDGERKAMMKKKKKTERLLGGRPLEAHGRRRRRRRRRGVVKTHVTLVFFCAFFSPLFSKG